MAGFTVEHSRVGNDAGSLTAWLLNMVRGQEEGGQSDSNRVEAGAIVWQWNQNGATSHIDQDHLTQSVNMLKHHDDERFQAALESFTVIAPSTQVASQVTYRECKLMLTLDDQRQVPQQQVETVLQMLVQNNIPFSVKIEDAVDPRKDALVIRVY
ncbi:MAG TPA: hypothetical protein VD999_04275 [Vitreimonas sp.]|nr:hypothetical protein [Vitreimonas sp.]